MNSFKKGDKVTWTVGDPARSKTVEATLGEFVWAVDGNGEPSTYYARHMKLAPPTPRPGDVWVRKAQPHWKVVVAAHVEQWVLYCDKNNLDETYKTARKIDSFTELFELER